MGDVFNLLMKARRDTSRLVQVQRTVTRGGKTFTQNYWVSPSQVKDTDKVIGGQAVLAAYRAKAKAAAAAIASFSYAAFDALKGKGDRDGALKYLSDNGITWNKSDNPGINWMRACMAAKKADGNAVPTPKTAPKPASKPNQVSSQSPDFDAALASIGASRAEFDACRDGREKVALIKKKLGKDGCYRFARTAGVTWDSHTHAAIDNMRMSMALAKYLDEKYGTASAPSSSSKQSKPSKPDKPDKPKANPDEIPEPKNATQRQKNIVKLINSLTDVDEIDHYAVVGMIPEDDVSKGFIYDKLYPKYVQWLNSHGKSTSAYSTKSTSKPDKLGEFNKSAWGFGRFITSNVGVQGISEDILNSAFNPWYTHFSADQLVNPTEHFAVAQEYSTSDDDYKLTAVMKALRNAYSTYTTDDFQVTNSGWYGTTTSNRYATNLGYTGWDTEEYSKRFDEDKDGFIKYINKVVENNPEVKPEADEMVSTYKEMMKTVGYNPNMLAMLLDRRSWETDGKGVIGSAASPELRPISAKIILNTIDYQANAIMEILRSRGYSDESIKSTLEHMIWSDDIGQMNMYDENNKRVVDANGEPVVENLKDAVNPATGEKYFNTNKGYSRFDNSNYGITPDEHTTASNEFIRACIRDRLFDKGLSSEYDNRLAKLKAFAGVTQDDYVKVHELSHKLFGLKAQVGGNDIDHLTYDDLTSDTFTTAPDAVSDHKDTILANMLLNTTSIEANANAYGYADNMRRSNVNKNGSDYSGNFDYYYPDSITRRSNKRLTNGSNTNVYGSSAATYTVDQLNDKIQSQLDSSVSVSSGYRKQLSDYYNAKGNFDADTIRKELSNSGFSSMSDIDSKGVSRDDIKNSPLKDIMFAAVRDVYSHVPKVVTRTKDFEQDMVRRMDYVPYDFTSTEQHTFSDTQHRKPKATSTQSKSALRTARDNLFKKANCTISTEDDATSLQMRKDMLENFDYDGKTHAKIYSGGKAGGDRRVLFNSRFFKINNSNMEDNFKEYAGEIGQTPDKDTYYHGTSYGSAAGIIGRSGGWNFNVGARSGRMLGKGAYFGNKVGKIMPYAADVPYSYTHSNPGTDADGVIILSSLLQGQPGERTTDDPDDPSNHTYILGYETAVRNNKCIFPHHMIDVSCRSLGRSVTRDSKGNYLDNNGAVTHDRYGKSVNME